MSSKRRSNNKKQQVDRNDAAENTAGSNNEAITSGVVEQNDATVAAAVNNKSNETTDKAAVVDDKKRKADVLLDGNDSKNSKHKQDEQEEVEAKPIMEYLQALMQEEGDQQFETVRHVEPFTAAQFHQSYPTGRTPLGKDYWVNGSPVLEKVDYNGESVMLPRLAPRDEKVVTVRKVVFDLTVSTIRDHQGGSKVNWGWKTQIFNSCMSTVSPALFVSAKQLLTTVEDFNTLNLFAFGDATLYGNTIQNELAIEDPADANVVLAASRASCRFIGLTLTLDPRRIIPQGTMVDAAALPHATTLRIYFRAPQNAAGGLLNAVTKDMLTQSPADILRVQGMPVFLAVDRGTLPVREAFDRWILDQRNHIYFEAMVQIARKSYIGTEVITETLQHRIRAVNQREWDPIAKKNKYWSANELHAKMASMVGETHNMTPDQIQQEVPELDRIFYYALVPTLQQCQEIARLLNHPPSTNLGENLTRLQAIVDATKIEEIRINQIARISAQNSYRRYPIADNAANRQGARTFAAQPVSNVNTPERFIAETAATFPQQASPSAYAAVPPAIPVAASAPSPVPQDGVTVFALTMLSNAERALRESSNSNAPLMCWGCGGVKANSDHLYKDCPYKADPVVQQNFKQKLDEYLTRRKKERFNPQTYKKDGFVTKMAVTLFNDICSDSLQGDSRTRLIESFVSECTLHRLRRRTRNTPTEEVERATRGNNANAPEESTGPISLPFWVVDEDLPGILNHDSFVSSFNFSPKANQGSIQYPITPDLPHVTLPVGRDKAATVEGLLDTGGACTMGDIHYWSEVSKRFPTLIAHYDELALHQEKPISIGGVGAGQVTITHVMGIWLPWMIGREETKLVIGLGDNMPMTLLIGLPFQQAAGCTIDVGNAVCHSSTFNASWKITYKRPSKKDVRALDAVIASGKRLTFPTTALVSPSPGKKIRWDWEAIEKPQYE